MAKLSAQEINDILWLAQEYSYEYAWYAIKHDKDCPEQYEAKLAMEKSYSILVNALKDI